MPTFELRREMQNPERIPAQIEVRAGLVVADLGCGNGFFTVPFAKAVGESGRVYAIDHDSRMLQDLRENLKQYGVDESRVVAMEADVARTTLPDASVDVAFFANVLHDIRDKSAFLGEVARIVKAGGIAVDIDWKKEDSAFGPPSEIRLTEVESRHILAENGFEVLRRVDAGPYHYGLLCMQVPRTVPNSRVSHAS